jgi:guanylate kinase
MLKKVQHKMTKGKLLVFSAPSGSGKTTIVRTY